MFDFCGGRLVRVCRHFILHITELLATLSVIYNVTLIVLLSALQKKGGYPHWRPPFGPKLKTKPLLSIRE